MENIKNFVNGVLRDIVELSRVKS